MSDPMTESRQAHLIEGLVGKRTDLYRNSAHFYHSLNALASMLPVWVDGFAAQAEEMDRALAAQVRAVER